MGVDSEGAALGDGAARDQATATRGPSLSQVAPPLQQRERYPSGRIGNQNVVIRYRKTAGTATSRSMPAAVSPR